MSSQNPVELRYGADAAGPAIERLTLLDTHPALRAVLERRTIRAYADRAVEPALIDALLDIAFSAPSKSDYQPATVLRGADAGARQARAGLGRARGAGRPGAGDAVDRHGAGVPGVLRRRAPARTGVRAARQGQAEPQ